jgi:hypothetical protein
MYIPMLALIISCHALAILYGVALTSGIYEECQDHRAFVSNKLWLILVGSLGLSYTSLILIGTALRSNLTSLINLVLGLGLLAWHVVAFSVVLDEPRDTDCVVKPETVAITYVMMFSMVFLAVAFSAGKKVAGENLPG